MLNAERFTERMSRILSFLNPSSDPQGASYQLTQSLVALGRGGWFGVGPGESVQKFQYLPKARTDMIFAILGEEFGLLGAGLVILLFGVFAVACWRLARRCDDPMGKLLIAGCGDASHPAGGGQHRRSHRGAALDRGTASVHQLRPQQPARDAGRRRR